MTTTAQSIIRRCVITLQDPTSIRWPVADLVRYLNDGQREVVIHRPDATVTTATRSLTTGTRQTLPTNGMKLIEVIRNSAGNKRAVRLCSREILDAQVPGWHNLSGVTEILHFMFDPRDPKVFYVYPPAAAANASVEISYGAYPVDVSENIADGSTWSSITGDIGLPDQYANILYDYVLYRAYSKDSEYAGNSARAVAHYTAFANALGIEIKGTLMVAPATTGNPGVIKPAAVA